jgi:hypothetical protein
MKKYADMTMDELSAAKQALDAEIKKLRTTDRRENETNAEREERISKIAQLRFAKADIQKEQDARFVPAEMTQGVTIGVQGISSGEKIGDIGGKPAKKKASKGE